MPRSARGEVDEGQVDFFPESLEIVFVEDKENAVLSGDIAEKYIEPVNPLKGSLGVEEEPCGLKLPDLQRLVGRHVPEDFLSKGSCRHPFIQASRHRDGGKDMCQSKGRRQNKEGGTDPFLKGKEKGQGASDGHKEKGPACEVEIRDDSLQQVF